MEQPNQQLTKEEIKKLKHKEAMKKYYDNNRKKILDQKKDYYIRVKIIPELDCINLESDLSEF
jgi:hypothetical protein